jgi:hypothetical protein
MKILIAEQDESKNGFTFTDTREMVGLGFVCCNSKTCGCGRSFTGFDSRKGTTLARVVETNLTKKEYLAYYRTSMELAGFAAFMDEKDTESEASELLRIAAFFPDRALVRRNKNTVTAI